MPFDLCEYPTSLGDSAKIVVAKLRGQTIAHGALVHAGWHCAGYAAGQMLEDEDDDVPPMMQSAQPCSQDQLAAHLEKAAAVPAEGYKSGEGMGAAVPWESIAMTLLPLLLQWLQKR